MQFVVAPNPEDHNLNFHHHINLTNVTRHSCLMGTMVTQWLRCWSDSDGVIGILH